jgi:predicted Zn-dependent protease
LLAQTRRGLLVSRFWYIRSVDYRKTIVTGMTRDGTFLIEDGKIAGGVRNLRFNQSILEALCRAEFSRERVRTGGYSYSLVIPTAKIEGFRFTSVTAF